MLAGPYCTLLLRELGARVLKVETPHGGDDSRHFGPWLPSGDSAYFETLNAGKESIALDLKKEEDMCTLHSLLAKADVLVENYRPGVMDRMGLGWEEIHKKYPRLCYASISGCGVGHSRPARSPPGHVPWRRPMASRSTDHAPLLQIWPDGSRSDAERI